MRITTTERSTVATVDGTFEDAYNFALKLWDHAGEEGVHMDGLEIWDDTEDEPTKILSINYRTHER